MEIKIENGEIKLKGDSSALDKVKDLLSSFLEEETSDADTDTDGLDYVIVRSQGAGVFAGYLSCHDGEEVELVNARRLWYWEGAASLSELAMKGVKYPDKCKFPCAVNSITIRGVCEIIETTQKAKKSIECVPEWKA